MLTFFQELPLHVTDSLFIILSNCAGLLGLIVGGVFAVLFTKIKKLLLSLLCVLNLFNILIFVVTPQVGLYFMISQYLMLGIYTALSTYFFNQYAEFEALYLHRIDPCLYCICNSVFQSGFGKV